MVKKAKALCFPPNVFFSVKQQFKMGKANNLNTVLVSMSYLIKVHVHAAFF